LKLIVIGGVVGTVVPWDNVMVPANPLRLVRVIVVLPVVIVVGLTVKPKSLTTTLRVTLAIRVSGLLEASDVA
jgi:hypothetical protein